jgi:hypothetical protein
MTTRIANAAAKAAADAVVALLDGGTGAGYIEIRTGSQPASVGTAASGTLLGTLPLSDPAFGAATTASPAVATADTITDDTTADASGTAGWFRAYDGDDTAIIDGDITTTGVGTGDMLLDDTAIVAGGTISITAWTVSMPTGA